jgi:hypothetical protein
MIIMRRESNPISGQRTIAYNGGKIPLVDLIPMLPSTAESRAQRSLKWIFAVTNNSFTRRDNGWEEMTKLAVLSALDHTTLKPVCIYSGAEGPLVSWLRQRNVAIIFHEPSWSNKLVIRVR